MQIKSPFNDCQFEFCDLPGQCKGEGKCHHPKQKIKDGFLIAPFEPTAEMLLAVETPSEYKFEVASHDSNVGIPAELAARIYKAMLVEFLKNN